jgi:hypothetical protein
MYSAVNCVRAQCIFAICRPYILLTMEIEFGNLKIKIKS